MWVGPLVDYPCLTPPPAKSDWIAPTFGDGAGGHWQRPRQRLPQMNRAQSAVAALRSTRSAVIAVVHCGPTGPDLNLVVRGSLKGPSGTQEHPPGRPGWRPTPFQAHTPPQAHRSPAVLLQLHPSPHGVAFSDGSGVRTPGKALTVHSTASPKGDPGAGAMYDGTRISGQEGPGSGRNVPCLKRGQKHHTAPTNTFVHSKPSEPPRNCS